MATIIEHVHVAEPRWRARHSALRLAVDAARGCLHESHTAPDELDLLVNAGIYRDRNLGEPALAALIQEDIGANPEDPHDDAHGTFSFDVANGTCGPLTATQVVDGFLRSHVVHRAMVVASDANPGHGLSRDFPFDPAGAAMLCRWTDDDCGLGRFHWASSYDDGGTHFRSTVALQGRSNVLRFHRDDSTYMEFARVAVEALHSCLAAEALDIDSVAVIVAAPTYSDFRVVLADRLGIGADRIAVASDVRAHTSALLLGIQETLSKQQPGEVALFLAAGAGTTAGAVAYRIPPG